jgi:hypothetical protein
MLQAMTLFFCHEGGDEGGIAVMPEHELAVIYRAMRIPTTGIGTEVQTRE